MFVFLLTTNGCSHYGDERPFDPARRVSRQGLEHEMVYDMVHDMGVVTTATTTAYWWRRFVVVALAIVLVGSLLSAAGTIAVAFGDVPASVPGRRPAHPTHVVQPGETLWSIARSLRPKGDITALVDRLDRANGGAALRVGQHLILP